MLGKDFEYAVVMVSRRFWINKVRCVLRLMALTFLFFSGVY